ncbi:MAG TPA: hypothetical protein VJK02_02010 [Anaerolineales bacterium]|nr:hypothetical protein [Anaerolineales bacterium]
MDRTLQDLLNLMREQVETLQREFGWVYSGTSNIVNYPHHPDNASLRPAVQARVNHLVQGSLLLYLFAMWEYHVPRDLETSLDQGDLLRLNAYRHLRHSVAHGYRGSRANSFRAEFEEVMSGQHRFPGEIWDPQNDTIDLSRSSISYECLQFMQEITKKLVVIAAS